MSDFKDQTQDKADLPPRQRRHVDGGGNASKAVPLVCSSAARRPRGSTGNRMKGHGIAQRRRYAWSRQGGTFCRIR